MVIAIIIIIILHKNRKFKSTSYYKITHRSMHKTRIDPGSYGEYLIFDKLKFYEERGGRFLFNCYIPKEDGKTTELDVILICSGGVFVFESKNYSEWIFGDEKSRTWTQVLPSGRGNSYKERFLNPIIQNKVHIKALENLVGKELPIFSVVAFSQRCTLKDINILDNNVRVVNRNNIEWAVNSLISNNSRRLSSAEIESIYNKLYSYTEITEFEKQQHIYNIRKKYDSNYTDVNYRYGNDNYTNNNMICPRCGAKLVARTAKQGQFVGQQFYGCSNYPKCRYTAKLD